MKQSNLNFIYLISFLLGVSLYTVNSMQNGKSGSRLPFLATTSSNCINKISNTCHVSTLKTRAIIPPVLVALSSVFLSVSPTLAETMETGNVMMASTDDHSLAVVSSFVSSNAYQLISSSTLSLASYDTFDKLYPVFVILLYAVICWILNDVIHKFVWYGFRGFNTSVVKLQIGLDAETWSDSDSKDIMSSGLPRERMLSEAAVTLLRKQADWKSATLGTRIYSSFAAAELEYHRLSVVERSKLQRVVANEKEGNAVADLIHNSAKDVEQRNQQWLDSQQGRSQQQLQTTTRITSESSSVGSEVVVVTLLALIRGKSSTGRSFWGDTRTTAEVRRSLAALASEALLDGGKNLQLAEVLCCPMAGAESKALSREDTLLLYPELWNM